VCLYLCAGRAVGLSGCVADNARSAASSQPYGRTPAGRQWSCCRQRQFSLVCTPRHPVLETITYSHARRYSGGRDGVICAWDLGLDLTSTAEPPSDYKPPPTAFRQQVQAHTHWINDIALAQSNQCLLSASSDITVKLWRPAATDGMPPQSIGFHTDYVKTLAVPSPTSDWVASGSLDRKICLWDLNGGGQKLCINVADDEAGSLCSKEKGSVYALAANNTVICSGGPESTVRVWDSRTGKRITKLVGHTDNIRDVLVSQDGSTILTASSDRTVKVWSTIAGRCMYTLTMHDASVWSLFSEHPDLSVFYSSDKNGLVAKTDTRNAIELDEGMSVAVCQEHEGVHKIKAAGAYLWTTTNRPSINRWKDVDLDGAEMEIPENYSYSPHRSSMSTTITRYPSPPARRDAPKVNGSIKKIPLKHMLRLSNTTYFPSPIVQEPENTETTAPGVRRGTLERASPELVVLQPVRDQPDYSVEGQNGLIKHVMLNDRKRVLTIDTSGEVVMWDLLKCVPIKSFDKRDLEDVKDEVTTTANVANWCTVDTRTGSVAVVLEENNCFDAEMYADELDLDEDIEFREDQRINLGKWVLRYLFSNLITEEIRRDGTFRKELLSNQEQQKALRENAPQNLQMPAAQSNGWHADAAGPPSASTVKPTNGLTTVTTPGVGGIGLATPGLTLTQTKSGAGLTNIASATEDGEPLDRHATPAVSLRTRNGVSAPCRGGCRRRRANCWFCSNGSRIRSPLSPLQARACLCLLVRRGQCFSCL
jgi:WD repeat-containing protein 48